MNPHLGAKYSGYVIVSPVRDEEQYIEKTILSVLRQSLRPLEWVIVDDGSRDDTGRIVDDYARQHEWIRALHRQDRGNRVPGGGVMEAFYAGHEVLKSKDWGYIVKLDGDVELPRHYFKECLTRCERNPRLGMCGGVMYSLEKGALAVEKNPRFHVRGPVKLYRRSCWDALGGLLRSPGWDTVDEVKANMLGWQTMSFADLHAIHLRPTGAEQGAWRDGAKNGRANYIARYHPLFMTAKCMKRLFQPPYLVGATSLLYGFLSGYLKHIPRVEDEAFIRYIHKQQLKRLCFLDSIWK